MIKKFYVSAVFAVLFLISGSMLFAQDANSSPDIELPGFQLLFSGELGYAGNSDMEKFTKAQGQNTADEYNAYAASIPIAGGFKVDETSSPDTTWGVDLEMRFFPGSSGFGFGMGTGIHGAESVSKVSSPHYADKVEYTTTLLVIPFVGTVYYETAVNDFSFVTFGAGLGKYYGMLDGELSSSHAIPGDVEVYEPIGDASAFGYHLKAEYSLFFKPLCLTVGVMGRYVQFKEFKDDNITIDVDAGLTGVSMYLAAGLAI